MTNLIGKQGRTAEHASFTKAVQRTPGKSTLVNAVYGDAARATSAETASVQRKGGGGDTEGVHVAADAGIAGPGGPLPFKDRIQSLFGAHDVSGVRAHTGAEAVAANTSLGSIAYAKGDNIAFSATPDLHTAAHEAAHVVQQRGGVQLSGGVGRAGDAYEQHADRVADLVVAGQSAESALNKTDTTGTAGGQRHETTHTIQQSGNVVQRQQTPDAGVPDAGVPDADLPVAGVPDAGVPDAAASDATEKDDKPPVTAPTGPVVRAGIDLTAIGQDQGIRVAVGYFSSATDVATNTASYQSHKLKDVLTWGNVKPAGDHPLIKQVVAQIAAGTSDPEANTKPADADLIARGVQGNNTEFGHRAAIHATQRKTIGGTAGALTAGKHIPFDEASGKPIEAIQAVSTAIGSLTPTAGATPVPSTSASGNIAEVAFFTHGVSTNIGLGNDGWMNGGAVAGKLGAYSTPSVQVLVYGCSAAGGKDSFAETLATALAKAGHKARVFGHTSAGPATVNGDGREFTAESDGAGGAKVNSATDYEMVFSIDFRTAEMDPVSTDLGIDLTKGSMYDGWSSNQYTVYTGIGNVSKTWLTRGLSKFVAAGGFAGSNDDGSKSTEEAAYTLGTSKDPTVASLRKEWQLYRSSPAGKAELNKQIPVKAITK